MLRAEFLEGDNEIALVTAPLALAMFQQRAMFRAVGLTHRNGTVMVANARLLDLLNLSADTMQRRDGSELAEVLQSIYRQSGRPTPIAVPHLQSTSTVVLYRYLQQYGLELGLVPHGPEPVIAVPVGLGLAAGYILGKANRSMPAALAYSLPWAPEADSHRFGEPVWLSRNIIASRQGHVDGLVLATDFSIAGKKPALAEFMQYMRIAGRDIETARKVGGHELDEVVSLLQKHLPDQDSRVIRETLDGGLDAIEYGNLAMDRDGLTEIMDWSLQAGILNVPVDVAAMTQVTLLDGTDAAR